MCGGMVKDFVCIVIVCFSGCYMLLGEMEV